MIYQQCDIVASTPDMQYPAYIGLTTDTPTNDIPSSPYSIRYYTQCHVPMSHQSTIQIRLQVDGGANCSLTNKKEYLSRYQSTQTYNIYGVTKDEIALQCTGKGYLPWYSENGDILYIPCYYSPNAAETIISPTDVVCLIDIYTQGGPSLLILILAGAMSPSIALKGLTTLLTPSP
jgi:hypothetical protein